ncbi:MAG: hypothetical protein ACM3S1_06540 [Hyphomicrobiales bacterium]
MSAKPNPGDNVYFMSGRLLGTLREVNREALSVETPDGLIWLARSAVFTAEARRVTLICERDGLKNYVVPGPG